MLLRAFDKFFKSDSAGGILLIVSAVAAMIAERDQLAQGLRHHASDEARRAVGAEAAGRREAAALRRAGRRSPSTTR